MEKRAVVSPETTPDTENVTNAKKASADNAAAKKIEIENLDSDFRKRAAQAAAKI